MIVYETINRFNYCVYNTAYLPDSARYYTISGVHVDYVMVRKIHIPNALTFQSHFDYYRIIPDIFMIDVCIANFCHLQPRIAIILSAKRLSDHTLANDGLPPELICINELEVLITCVDITRKRNMPKLKRFEQHSNPGKLLWLIKNRQFDELLKPQIMTKSAASYICSANADVVD